MTALERRDIENQSEINIYHRYVVGVLAQIQIRVAIEGASFLNWNVFRMLKSRNDCMKKDKEIASE